jgi:hypothetical protein
MQPRSCGPNTMTMQKPMLTANHSATCSVVPCGPWCSLYPKSYEKFACCNHFSIALTAWSIWPIIVLLNNIPARHELELGFLQNTLDNLIPRIKQVHRTQTSLVP